MVALVETIEREIGRIEVAVFNIGGNVRFPRLGKRRRASISRCGRCAPSPAF